MSKPLVSVITTVYNCEKYIEESLMSIFGQTFKDFEFIVFNDASIDNTMEIIEKTFCDFDGDYIIINSDKEKNSGCAVGRNIAIDRARGKYLAIHDGDDISYSNRLEKEVGLIEACSDLFCVGSWCDSINADGTHRGVFDYPKEDHNDFVKDIFSGDNTMIDPSTLFRRDGFYRLGGYDSGWNFVPDLHFWIKALIGGYYFSNIQESLIAHRRHSESVMLQNYRSVVFQHNLLNRTLLSKYKKEVFFRN